MKPLGKSALLFVGIGLILYAGVYAAAEQLMYRTGKTNAFYKIASVEEREFDWLILGASHAMPLDFDDFNAFMQRETGLSILNLASPGTGPLYNRFVLERFLKDRRTRNLLYVADSFTFHSRTWNEDRFGDAKLLARTPLDRDTARLMTQYSLRYGVDARAVVNYVTGFAKINNRNRFEADVWEGEQQFDRVYRPSAAAVRSRISYLYPEVPPTIAFPRYLDEFAALVETAQHAGARVVAIKTPVPARFYKALPEEAAFDEAFSAVLARRVVPFHDFSLAMDEPRFYFDTDHLNRVGLTEFFNRHLKALLVPEEGAANGAPASSEPNAHGQSQ